MTSFGSRAFCWTISIFYWRLGETPDIHKNYGFLAQVGYHSTEIALQSVIPITKYRLRSLAAPAPQNSTLWPSCTSDIRRRKFSSHIPPALDRRYACLTANCWCWILDSTQMPQNLCFNICKWRLKWNLWDTPSEPVQRSRNVVVLNTGRTWWNTRTFWTNRRLKRF